MTVSLGGIALSDDLVLQGIEEAPGIAMSARRTLGGRQIVQVGPSLAGGRVLSLQSENHLTLSQITAIKAIESTGQAVILVHHRGTFSVLITGTEVDPDTLLANPDTATNQWWSGKINMIEV